MDLEYSIMSYLLKSLFSLSIIHSYPSTVETILKGSCIIGCPTLHYMHQIIPFQKYFIPIYKNLGFPNVQSCPASFSVSLDAQKIQKTFKIYRGNCSKYAFKFFHFIKNS